MKLWIKNLEKNYAPQHFSEKDFKPKGRLRADAVYMYLEKDIV